MVLGVDPGATSGAGIVVPDASWRPRLVRVASCDVWDPAAVSAVVADAFVEATRRGVDLVLACETWGAGGIMGINAWLGLGEARGVWKAVFLAQGGTRKRIVHVNMNEWRGAMLLETGQRDETGKHVRFDTDEWKRQATRTLAELTEHRVEIPGADAGEAGCLALHAARMPAVLDALGKRYIARHSWPAWAA